MAELVAIPKIEASPVLLDLREYFVGLFDFVPSLYQCAFALDCLRERRVVGVFCRQSGKSTVISMIAVLLARMDFKGNILILAPTDRQCGLLADKIRWAVHQLPTLSDFQLSDESARSFTFSNGKKIICETVGDFGETIRGYTAGVIILEEAGSIKDSIVENVILPMGATTDAKIIKIGTPRGKNHFFESSVSPLYKVHKYNYTYGLSEGILKQSYIDEMRLTLSDISWRTEIMAEFIEDQDAYFSYDLIDSCRDNSLNYTLADDFSYTPKLECAYYLGGDIARLGQDETCLVVLEADAKRCGQVVKVVELKKCTLDVVIDRIKQLHNTFKFRRIFLDETGLGAGVTDILAKWLNQTRVVQGQLISGFPKNYMYGDKVIGVKFTIKSKLDLFSNLKAMMQQGRVRFPNHLKLISQLRDFRYELTENDNVKLHHSDGGFDDCVDALCLAVKELSRKPNTLAMMGSSIVSK